MQEIKDKNNLNFGIITLAMGEYYRELALVLLESLRRHMPHIKVAVVTDDDLKGMNEYFDYVIPLDKKHGTTLRQKLFLHDYSPFEKTMFIDADSIVLRDFQKYCDHMIHEDYAFTSAMGHRSKTRDHKTEWISDPFLLEKKTEIKYFYHPHGGLYFWDQEKGKEWFYLAQEFYDKFDEKTYGLNKLPGHGFNEEIAFGLAADFFEKRDGENQFFRPTQKFMTTSYHSRIIRGLFGGLYVTKRTFPYFLGKPCIFHFFHRNTEKPLYQLIKKDALRRLKKIK